MPDSRTTASQAARRLALLGDSLAGQLDDGGDARAADRGTGADGTDPRVPGGAERSLDGSAAQPAAARTQPPVPGRHAARAVSRAERIGAGVADRVPGPVRAAWATRLGGAHLAVLALLLAVGLCVAAWWALSARPQPQAMPAMAPMTDLQAGTPAPAADASPTAADASPTAAAEPPTPTVGAQQVAGEEVVVVDVAGRVRRPGIVTLPAGSRVADALDAAGGPRGGVALTSLNLARLLVDGEQLLVGVQAAVPPVSTGATPGPPGDPLSSGPPAALVDLNTATEAQLDTLPGVGPVTATAILGWRTEHGGFTSVDELLEVTGIGEVTLEELRPLVTV